MTKAWRQIITLQSIVVIWTATSLFQPPEVRQSKASGPHLDKRSFLEIRNLMVWVQPPWMHHSAILLWGTATCQGTDRLLSSSKSERISSLLSCSCLSLSEALTSQFPVHPSHPRGTQVGKTGKLCFLSLQQKTPLTHGNTRGLTTFWSKWRENTIKTRNIINQPLVFGGLGTSIS